MNIHIHAARKLNILSKLTGATYPELFMVWIVINVAFAAMYLALNVAAPEHGPTLPTAITMQERLFESFYFSVVTATSTGYGDILPMGFSKVLAMIQCTMALLVFAVLVGKLVSQRQDLTLSEVHRMSFEGIFYHIRHVLFIVRKDFDSVILKADADKKLEAHDWGNLSTAYLQAQSLVEEIPELYDSHGIDLRSVDLKREMLLFESVHRTLERIETLMQTLNKHRIDWRTHEQSMHNLRRLVKTIDAIMPLWRERSPYHEEHEFADLKGLSERLHSQMHIA